MRTICLLALFVSFPVKAGSSSYVTVSPEEEEYTGCYICRCSSRKRAVNCSSLGLHSLPSANSFPRTTTDFEFANNRIRNVEESYFLPFENLAVINGDNNTLSILFHLPKSLEKLSLRNNSLQAISGFFLNESDLNFLRSVDLGQNQITRLPSGTFTKLPRLKKVVLNENRLQGVESQAFSHLPSLTVLDLSSNKLRVLKKDQFLRLGGGDTTLSIFLRNNNFRNIGEEILDLPSVHFLAISNSEIETINPLAFRLLPGLKTLDLSGNKIRQIKENTFQNQSHFESIDLSQNNLSTLNGSPFRSGISVASLILHTNQLTHLEESLLETINVSSLEISGNHLSELPQSLSKQSQLYLLNCMMNNLGEIRQSSFRNLRKLKFLNFMGNNISKFESSAFADLDRIEQIYLQDNPPLYNLPRNAFLFDRFKGNSTKIFLRCSKTKEIPMFTNTTHVYCVTQATNITLNTTKKSSKFLSQEGYVCRVLENGHDFMGAASCTQCPVGTEPVKHQDRCNPCPAGGFYQDAAGQTKCKLCVPGTYVPFGKDPGISAANCTVCPEGTNTTKYANFRACFCLPNYYRTYRFGRCFPCLDSGQNCTGEYVSANQGYWMSWNIYNDTNTTSLEDKYIQFIDNLQIKNVSYPKNNSMRFDHSFPKIHECPIPDSCNGSDPTKPRIKETDTCSPGYEGPLCAVCKTSYYSWFQKCYECPPGWRTGLQIAGVATLFTVAMLLLYVADKARRDKSRTLVDHIAAKIKIIIGFGQVMAGVFQAMAYIPWPKVLLSFGHYLKLLELNVIAVATPSCLSFMLRLDAVKAPIFSVISQAAILLVIWMYYGIRYIVLPRLSNKMAASVQGVSLARTSCLRNTWWILFVCYPATTAQIMALLPYKPWTCLELCLSTDPSNPHCKWFLKDDLSVKCNYEDEIWIVFWSLILYVVVLPIALFIGLLYKRKAAREKSSSDEEATDDDSELLISPSLRPVPFKNNLIQSLQFLDENYKPKYWYWEITEIFRKFLLTCGFQYFGQTSHSAVALAALMANLFLLLHAQLQPIKRKSDHWLQLLSLLVISLNLMIGTLMALSYDNNGDVDSQTDQEAFSIIVLAVNGFFVIYLLGKFFFAIIRAWKEVRKHHKKFLFYPFLVYFVNSEDDAERLQENNSAELSTIH